MKQFRLAAGLVALAMLGACSSEEPVTPGGATEDGVQGMYLSLNIAGPENTTTRGTKKAESYEETIQRIQILVCDKDGQKFLDKTINAGDKIVDEDGSKVDAFKNNTVLFTVTNTQFTEMKKRAGEDWEILVYVNGVKKTRDEIMFGYTDNKTWGVENEDGDGYNKVNNVGVFAMSNAAPCKGALKALGDNHGKSVAKAWEIAATVNLSRLATRFDYFENSTDNTYTLLSDNNVKLKLVGMGVNTMANHTFCIAQYSKTGRIGNGDDDARNCTHFTNVVDGTEDKKLRRVTEVFGVPSDYPGSYKEQNYFIIPNGDDETKKTTIYARPNTISDNITEATLSFKKVPYAAVKAQIILSGTNADENSSYYHEEPLFAVNGILIGGARDLHRLMDAEEQFKVDYDLNNFDQDKQSDVQKAIKEVEDAVNNFMYQRGHAHSDLDVPANLSNANKDIVEYLHADKYEYNESAGGYFTYYASYIQHEDSDDLCWKYGVSRNTVYQLGVSSFGFLGNNGDGEIGDGPGVSELQDLIMKLTVVVNKWELNELNKGWNLGTF